MQKGKARGETHNSSGVKVGVRACGPRPCSVLRRRRPFRPGASVRLCARWKGVDVPLLTSDPAGLGARLKLLWVRWGEIRGSAHGHWALSLRLRQRRELYDRRVLETRIASLKNLGILCARSTQLEPITYRMRRADTIRTGRWSEGPYQGW